MLLAEMTTLAASGEVLRRLDERKREGTRTDCPNVPRERKSVTQVYREMGAQYFRRSFRMNYLTFRVVGCIDGIVICGCKNKFGFELTH